MTLTDSGPLAALLNRNDQHHRRSAAAAPSISSPMITTLACFTEAMHFLGRDIGWEAKAKLWQLVVDGRLEIHSFDQHDLERMRELMEKYRDTPMGVADASLVVLAENLNETLIFTLDSLFRAYRLRDRRVLTITPDS
jgi:predicted nucleic acid-binding protein